MRCEALSRRHARGRGDFFRGGARRTSTNRERRCGAERPSHIVHSEEAARVERPTAGHTLVGLLVNTAATLFWATVFEKVQGRHKPSAISVAAAGTAAAACVTDYQLGPAQASAGL